MRSSAHTVVTVTTPLPVLPYRPRYCRPTCAVLIPSLRSPGSSITSTPASCGAVAGSFSSSSSRRSFTCSGSHRDSERKNCSRCTAGCCAPVTGSAPASAVSVLFRSRGASSPARYSRNPRRCATRVNRSSNRAAYSSSGPGAGGHGTGFVISHHRLLNSPGNLQQPYPPSALTQQTTDSSTSRPASGSAPWSSSTRSQSPLRQDPAPAIARRQGDTGALGRRGRPMDVLRWILYRRESCRPSLRGPGDLGCLVGNRPDRNQSIISSGPCTIATIQLLC